MAGTIYETEYGYEDEYGFEVDRSGRVLDTDYNRELEYSYRQAEERKERDRDNGRIVPRRRSAIQDDEDDYDRPVSRRRSGSPEPHRRNFVGSSSSNNAKSKKPIGALFDEEEEEGSPVKKRVTEPKVASKSVASLNKEIKINEISIPIDGNYLDYLLPFHLMQKRIFINSAELKSGVSANYYKREILERKEEDDMGQNDNMFGEGMFEDRNLIPLELNGGALQDVFANTDATVDLSCDLVNTIIEAVHSYKLNTPKDDTDIYIGTIFTTNLFFNNTGKELFLDELKTKDGKVIEVSEFLKKISEIYRRYSENDMTRNGIEKIDKTLVNIINLYIRAYSGDKKYKLYSFFKGISDFYKQVMIPDKIKDATVKANLIKGLNAFIYIFQASINEFANKYSDFYKSNKDSLICPLKDLLVATKNKDILNELNGIEESKDYEEGLFYMVSSDYTPYLYDMLSRIDKDRKIQSFSRVIFYNFNNVYNIIKYAENKFAISIQE